MLNTLHYSLKVTFICTWKPKSLSGSPYFPWSRKWHPLQSSCLENPVDRGAWRAAVRGVAELDMTECTCAERLAAGLTLLWGLEPRRLCRQLNLLCPLPGVPPSLLEVITIYHCSVFFVFFFNMLLLLLLLLLLSRFSHVRLCVTP